MSKNTSIILSKHFENFIKNEVKSGRYNNASEVIRSGLRLLETEKQKIKAINKALVIGEQSGQPKKYRSKVFRSRLKKKINVIV